MQNTNKEKEKEREKKKEKKRKEKKRKEKETRKQSFIQSLPRSGTASVLRRDAASPCAPRDRSAPFPSLVRRIGTGLVPVRRIFAPKRPRERLAAGRTRRVSNFLDKNEQLWFLPYFVLSHRGHARPPRLHVLQSRGIALHPLAHVCVPRMCVFISAFSREPSREPLFCESRDRSTPKAEICATAWIAAAESARIGSARILSAQWACFLWLLMSCPRGIPRVLGAAFFVCAIRLSLND